MTTPIPLVSVWMITYNHAAYVSQAIESVLAQDATFEYELVIGEDCSTDGTRAICEEHAARDRRIRLLPSTHNLGSTENCVRTLLACTGKYIALCEGDDYWTDHSKLQTQVDFLEHNSAYAGCASQALVVTHDGQSRLFRQHVPDDISVRDLIGGRIFHTASLVFRRTVVDLFVNAPRVLSGDRLLNLCAAITGPLRYSQQCTCVYRIHASGMSSSATIDQMLQDLNCISYLKDIYPPFPKNRYLSYAYATIGMCENGALYRRVYYLALSFVFSFSYFPGNIRTIVGHTGMVMRSAIRAWPFRLTHR